MPHARAVNAAGQGELEVEPDLVGRVFQLAADPSEGGRLAATGRDHGEAFAQIALGERVELRSRCPFEGDFLPNGGAERGLEVVGEDAHRDLEALGRAVVVRLRDRRVDRVRGRRGREQSQRGDEERRAHARVVRAISSPLVRRAA